MKIRYIAVFLFCFITMLIAQNLKLNDLDYFETPGLNVMFFHDYYPEGHQGGVSIIQNGVRVATNGDVRLEPTPGQWQPIPKMGKRTVDRETQIASITNRYPDPDRNRKGFNPIFYPDFEFEYSVHIQPEGNAVRVWVNLDEPLPKEWVGKVGFNLELFPGHYWGHTFYMDEQSGLFSRQLNGPVHFTDDQYQVEPMATGKQLVVAPDDESKRMTITAVRGTLQLIDGRAEHNNNWFVVRSALAANATEHVAEWLITPSVLPNWKYEPVIHLTQVGFHPKQSKIAVIECDANETEKPQAQLYRVQKQGDAKLLKEMQPTAWGKFIRYFYYQFDFSEIEEPGIYFIQYGESKSQPFKIDADVYERHVWQPTLEYFLPIQMCHMRVNDRYRVWHDYCHLDDARMAPTDLNHFDGYRQGSSTLTKYKSGETVPGLNVGGWHDAGDYDLRVESQATTVQMLAYSYEEFGIHYDETTIDQQKKLVELHRPDGVPDILQQIEHGVLAILGGYRNLGRLYRGIICPDLRQYVLLGEGANMTDNRMHDANLQQGELGATTSWKTDDRWVFTEENPRRELGVAAALAAASRALVEYNPELSQECLQTAIALFEQQEDSPRLATSQVNVLAELILATQDNKYIDQLIEKQPVIEERFSRCGWSIGRIMPLITNKDFHKKVKNAAELEAKKVDERSQQNPFGIPYRPNIWGAGWNIQSMGVQNYFLHKGWPDIFSSDLMFNALNFVLGCHPGENTASFVSGVGAHSVTAAYGTSRADWGYIPGGSVSGTAYIRPDFPELKEWPFFWQQTEYVMGGGATNFMFLALAAQNMLR